MISFDIINELVIESFGKKREEYIEAYNIIRGKIVNLDNKNIIWTITMDSDLFTTDFVKNQEIHENMYSFTYNERLEFELEYLKVYLTMSIDEFKIKDVVYDGIYFFDSGGIYRDNLEVDYKKRNLYELPLYIKETFMDLLKVIMLNEQLAIPNINREVYDSIPKLSESTIKDFEKILEAVKKNNRNNYFTEMKKIIAYTESVLLPNSDATIDLILDKINKYGIDSLNDNERKILNNKSKK